MPASNAPSRLTQSCLRVFVASVVASAISGAVAVSGATGLDWLEVRVFATTLIVAGTSVCGLACVGCLTRGHRVIPSIGIALAVVSGVLALTGVWGSVDEKWFWKTLVLVIAFGIASAHLSLLFMADLRGAYRWAHVAAYQVIYGLAGLIAAGVMFDLFDSEPYWRLTGVLSVASAALTLLIPVLHYFSRGLAQAAADDTDPVLRIDEQIAYHKKRLNDLVAERERLLGRGVDLSDPPS